MAAGGDAQVNARAIAQDGVHAKSAVAGVPFAGVLMVADAGHHLPGVAAVAAAEERGRLDAAPEVFLALARFQRPDISQRPAVFLGKGRGGFRLFELLAQVGRIENLHAEESVAAGGIDFCRIARVDQAGVDGDAGAERPAQLERAAFLARLGDEEALLGSDAENDAIRHVQPPG